MVRRIDWTLLLGLACAAPAAAQLTVHATSVEPLGGLEFKGSLEREHIVDAGVVSHSSFIDGAPSNADFAWWVDGGLEVREGDAAPGLPGLSLIPLSASIGSTDDLLFISFLGGAPSGADLALFAGPVLVAREGDLVAATGNADRYGNFPNTEHLARQDSQLAFGWSLVDAGTAAASGEGLFKGTASSQALVARTSQGAPGLPEGYVFNSFNDVSLSPGNRLAFIASTSSLEARGATSIQGVWRTGFGAQPSLVARSGVLGPGNIGPIDSIQDVSFAGDDELILQASIAPSPLLENAVWITGAGSAVVKTGDQIDGRTLLFVTRVAGNGNKRMAFFCHFSTFVALCLADPIQGVEVVIREGDAAPQIDGGVTIATLRTQPTLNRFDQIAFYALLTGPGVDFTNDSALFFRHSDGSVSLVAREGATYDLGPLGVATIHATASVDAALRFRDNGSLPTRFGIYDGHHSPLTDTGTVVFWANFLGLQEFEAIVVAAPDPDGLEIFLQDGFESGGRVAPPRR